MMSTNNDEKKKNKKEEEEDEEGGRSESDAATGGAEDGSGGYGGNERGGAASNNRGQSPTYPTEHREVPGAFGTGNTNPTVDVESGKAKARRSRPETIPADEPPLPGYMMHSTRRQNEIIKEEQKEQIEDDANAADDKPRPETISVQEPPHPAYHQVGRHASEEEKQEIVSADFEGDGGRMSSRIAVREMMALQEGGTGPGKEARENVDSPDFPINEEPIPQDEDEAEAEAAVPAIPSASSDVRPGAVAVSHAGAANHGTSTQRRSRDSSGANRDGDGIPDEAIVVTAEAYAVEEGNVDEPPMAAAVATVVERRTVCGIDRARAGWVLAAIGIAAAVIVGVMAGTGAMTTQSTPTTEGTGTEPIPGSAPVPPAAPNDPPVVPVASGASEPTMESTPDDASVPMPPAAKPTVSPVISPTLTAGETTPGPKKSRPPSPLPSTAEPTSPPVSASKPVTSAVTQAPTAEPTAELTALPTRSPTATPANAGCIPSLLKLLPNDGAAGDWFGINVSVDGDTVVIGAEEDDDNGSNSGSAYVFARTGTTWAQQAKLLPDDGAADDQFGFSVSLDGGTVVIGANQWNTGNSGKVYVFTRSGTAWSQQKKLLPDDGAGGDEFGFSVAVDSTTVFVGAPADDNDNGEGSGGAYSFELC